jgi:nucleotide-binding universal stress UspA family protein
MNLLIGGGARDDSARLPVLSVDGLSRTDGGDFRGFRGTAIRRYLKTGVPMNTVPAEAGNLYLVVGYDGSAPAVRALDAAIRLLRGRAGRIEVIYVAHMTTAEMMSADAIVEMEQIFDEMARDLQAQAAGQLEGREDRWRFERRQGPIAEELVAAAGKVPDAGPADTVAIVVGSSSQAAHRMIGSVAVSLARHTTVPLVVVP